MEKITVKEIVTKGNLEIVFGNDYLERTIHKALLSRPSVEIYSGYFEYFEFERVQIMGSKELAVFEMLNDFDKKQRISKLFEYDSPVYIFSKNVDAPKEFIEAAIKHKIPILKSNLPTSILSANLTTVLTEGLAERKSIHGVMLDINGVGVLITGPSGIGKSETALELLSRGHILVADDRVDVYQRDKGMIIAESPKITEQLMEIRGIGIVNIAQLYGIGACRDKKRIMLVVDLVKWENATNIDRVGLSNEVYKIFDTEISKITIPVQPGRNMATLIEAAALNSRLKYNGYDSAKEFVERINNLVNKK